MKNFSLTLTNILASGGPLYRADLFQIGPCDNGAVIYATNGQQDIVYNGISGLATYSATAFGSWSRGSLTTKIGLSSNGLDLTVMADPTNVPVYFPGTSNGALLLDGIKRGLLGQAPVTIYTVYMPNYGQGLISGGIGAETKFIGMVGPVKEVGLTKAVISVQDMLYYLNIKIPRKVFQPSCSHTLYDQVCTMVSTSFQRSGTVLAVTYPYQFTTTAHLAPISAAGTFTLGTITWTTGKNAGLTSFVRTWTAGGGSDTIVLDVQPIFGVSAGDTFTINQGCNKTFTSCLDFQGNTNAYINFGGQPFIPVPETAI